MNKVKYKNIKKYNELWEQGILRKPLVILIGGYCGTGKSTLAANIAKQFNTINTLPTGIIRSTLQHSLKPSQNPYIYEHTYNLHKLGTHTDLKQRIVSNFNHQVMAVADAINYIIKFVATEKQNYIIEGNHIIAGNNIKLDEVIVIDFYTKVSDPKIHFEFLGGPTHNREVNEEQFNTGRIIQDYIVQTANIHGKEVFEFDNSLDGALKIIDAELATVVEPFTQQLSSKQQQTNDLLIKKLKG